MRAQWNLGIGALAAAVFTGLLAASAVAQDAPQEEGLNSSVSERRAETRFSGGGGGGGGMGGTTLSEGSIALHAGFRVGAGGELDDDGPGDDDLLATFGLQLGGEYVLHKYVALGGEFRMGW